MYRYNPDTECLPFRHRGERVFMFDGTLDTGSISTEAKFCENCPWGKTDFNKNMVKCSVSLSLCQFFLTPVAQHGQAAASELPRLCPLHRPGRGAVWRWGSLYSLSTYYHIFLAAKASQ